MPHYTTGLPKLDLEPFDATPLYVAARSPRRDKDQPRFKPSRRPVYTLALAVLSLLGAAGAAVFVFV